ncbi:hypothetical protein OESDEN_10670 [Oesophagostomum dentatum]|uniref:Uncharacterized protein n=1 Tax=Oesophagostomum dentatum TaxID=61180 RepID=A0A0B1SW13_OESDE|nr:hypothetical protein OESDEN_10670 [Oesophagostomum dentatum]
MEDEEPLLPSKLQPAWYTPWRTPSKPNLQRLPLLKELPSPLSIITTVRSPSYTSLRELPEIHPPIEESLKRVHSACGLLSSDFDSRSNSSRSTMVDSGYDKSHHEDNQKQALLSPSSPWLKSDTVGE